MRTRLAVASSLVALACCGRFEAEGGTGAPNDAGAAIPDAFVPDGGASGSSGSSDVDAAGP